MADKNDPIGYANTPDGAIPIYAATWARLGNSSEWLVRVESNKAVRHDYALVSRRDGVKKQVPLGECVTRLMGDSYWTVSSYEPHSEYDYEEDQFWRDVAGK